MTRESFINISFVIGRNPVSLFVRSILNSIKDFVGSMSQQ